MSMNGNHRFTLNEGHQIDARRASRREADEPEYELVIREPDCSECLEIFGPASVLLEIVQAIWAIVPDEAEQLIQTNAA